MASRTADALHHMDAVIKVNETRQVMHSRPFDRFAGAKAFPDGF